MRVVIDTNVLVAALRSRLGASFQIVSSVPSDKFQVLVSLPLYFEYCDVLLRPELIPVGVTESDVSDFIENILSNSETRDIHYLWRPTLRDANDEMLLDLAVAGGAEYIVTFNTKDFVNLELFGIEAILPFKFLGMIR